MSEEIENLTGVAKHEDDEKPSDSKYRLIIVAARRSKQLQRGARPRVEIDTTKHKMTRVALAEVMAGKIEYTVLEGK